MPDPDTTNTHFGAIIIGAGNAGYSAATTAAQLGVPRVLLIDKGPPGSGGNTYFTAGAYRTVFHGLDDVLPLVTNVSPEQVAKIDMAAYTEADFLADLNRVTDGRTDPVLASTLVKSSRETIGWLKSIGIQFTLSFNRQAYEVSGRQKFWGGMVLGVKDGGKGLVRDHAVAADRAGVTTWFNTPATKLLTTLAGAITGVEVLLPNGTPARLSAPSIILACGGFESSRQLRAQHLGPGWDLAYVRGTAHNTGDGFAMTSAFSQPVGDWSGCHSTAWDAAAPKNEGDPVLTNAYTKSGYPLGIMVNLSGNRFVDEGVDFRNFTYARFGNEILKQPGGMAWQVWDSKTVGWLRAEEYADNVAKEKVKAETAEELACCMFPVDQAAREKFLETLAEYNAAVVAHQADFPGRVWDPAVKDGVSTKALKLPKSNWALTIEKGPFLAVKVTCGVTFTFGGLKIEPETAAVLSRHTGKPVEGLFACGEMVGGLFWGNYPGGSGLTAGAVWGRKAGQQAAKLTMREGRV